MDKLLNKYVNKLKFRGGEGEIFINIDDGTGSTGSTNSNAGLNRNIKELTEKKAEITTLTQELEKSKTMVEEHKAKIQELTGNSVASDKIKLELEAKLAEAQKIKEAVETKIDSVKGELMNDIKRAEGAIVASGLKSHDDIVQKLQKSISDAQVILQGIRMLIVDTNKKTTSDLSKAITVAQTVLRDHNEALVRDRILPVISKLNDAMQQAHIDTRTNINGQTAASQAILQTALADAQRDINANINTLPARARDALIPVLESIRDNINTNTTNRMMESRVAINREIDRNNRLITDENDLTRNQLATAITVAQQSLATAIRGVQTALQVALQGPGSPQVPGGPAIQLPTLTSIEAAINAAQVALLASTATLSGDVATVSRESAKARTSIEAAIVASRNAIGTNLGNINRYIRGEITDSLRALTAALAALATMEGRIIKKIEDEHKGTKKDLSDAIEAARSTLQANINGISDPLFNRINDAITAAKVVINGNIATVDGYIQDARTAILAAQALTNTGVNAINDYIRNEISTSLGNLNNAIQGITQHVTDQHSNTRIELTRAINAARDVLQGNIDAIPAAIFPTITTAITTAQGVITTAIADGRTASAAEHKAIQDAVAAISAAQTAMNSKIDGIPGVVQTAIAQALAGLQAAIEGLDRKIDGINTHTTAEVSRIKRELDTTVDNKGNAIIAMCDAQVKEANRLKGIAEGLLADKILEYATLQGGLAESQRLSAEDVAKREAIITQLRAQLDAVSRERDTAVGENGPLRAQVTALTAEVGTLRAEIAAKNQSISDITSTAAMSNQEVGRLQAEFGKLKGIVKELIDEAQKVANGGITASVQPFINKYIEIASSTRSALYAGGSNQKQQLISEYKLLKKQLKKN